MGAICFRSMMIVVGVLGACCVSVAAGPRVSSEVREQYCAQASDLNFFRGQLAEAGNRIGFSNPLRGTLNLPTGLCWWHSRYQRSVAHLMIFRPLKPGEKEMSSREVDEAIYKLRKMNRVVEIRTNKFENFQKWSYFHKRKLHKTLQRWQGWEALNAVLGLEGSTHEDPQRLARMMDLLYRDVEEKNKMVYQMLQLPGVEAHAWLVLNMEKTTDGYNIHYVDSNYPYRTKVKNYKYGMTTFKYSYTKNFVPYTQRESELRKILGSVLHYCRPRKALQLSEQNIAFVAEHTGVDLFAELMQPQNLNPEYPEQVKTFEDIIIENTLGQIDINSESWKSVMLD